MKINLKEDYFILDFDSDESEKWAYKELRDEMQRLQLKYPVNAIGMADSIDGGWCISRDTNFWLVYHSERGVRSGLSIFTSPFDAVNYFIWTLIASPTEFGTTVGRLPRLSK
jgi:hypothetical protein